MFSQLLRHFCILAFAVFAQFGIAADIDRAALNATADILFSENESKIVTHIAEIATFNAQEKGSLLRSIGGGSGGQIAEQIDSVTLFDQSELHTLEKAFPNAMWRNVSKRIGNGRGVFVRFRLAESSSLGSAPAGTPGMLVFVVRNYEGEPKITHLSTEDEK